MNSVGAERLVHRRVRAPQDDRTSITVPTVSESLAAAEDFRTFASQGFSGPYATFLSQLNRSARKSIVALATKYTSTYQDVSWTNDRSLRAPLVLGGHQSYLYHPGVWLKNFSLSSLAQRMRGLAINWIVDNDTAHAAEIRVPRMRRIMRDSAEPIHAGERPDFWVESIALDSAPSTVPFEEQSIIDESLLTSFAQRVQAALPEVLTSEIPTPLLQKLWPLVLAAYQRRKESSASAINLGETIAEGRHQLEASLGLQTLELPLSQVCQTKEFHLFSALLLENLNAFAGHYNRLLAHYRQVNKIRSHAHPMPNLTTEGDWQEAPFWIWTAQRPERRRLFVKSANSWWHLSDRQGTSWEIPKVSSTEFPGDAQQQAFAAAEAAGIKIRPRAILTTLFSRLVVGDLFVHGIGGAKYDELTDALMRDFFEIEPPPFQTITATVRLPLPFDPRATSKRASLQQQLRGVSFRGETFFDPLWQPHLSAAQWQKLGEVAAEKKVLLQTGWVEGEKSVWHLRVHTCNLQLQDVLTPVTQHLVRELALVEQEVAEGRILGSREFSLALFDQQDLPKLLLDFCQR